MATRKTAGENATTTNASLGRAGSTLTNDAKITVSSFGLRKQTTETDGTKSYGKLIQGQEAIDIATSYNVANQESKLAKLAIQLNDVKNRTGIQPVVRTLTEGQSVTDRASDYVKGQILGYLNTVPSRFSVAGNTYLYESTKVTKYLSAEDALKVLRKEAYIGNQGTDAVMLLDDQERTNVLCVSKEMLQAGIAKFKEILDPKVQGNSLYYGATKIVDFVSADSVAEITHGQSNFDLSSISVF